MKFVLPAWLEDGCFADGSYWEGWSINLVLGSIEFVPFFGRKGGAGEMGHWGVGALGLSIGALLTRVRASFASRRAFL
jgi:hypothetical protein